MGLTAHLTGNGVVASQSPAPGTPVEPGLACSAQAGTHSGRRRVAGCGAMNLASLPGVDSSRPCVRLAPRETGRSVHRPEGTQSGRRRLCRRSRAPWRCRGVADRPRKRLGGGALGDCLRRARGDGGAGDGVLWTSEPIDAGGRHHRYERQDDDRVFITRCARVGWKKVRPPRHRRLLDRRSGAAGVAHDAGGAGCAADVPSDGRRGMRRVCHGSVVARACATTSRRHVVRRRRVYEPDAGPPRLSRRHGVVLHGQEAAVRHASTGCTRRHQP